MTSRPFPTFPNNPWGRPGDQMVLMRRCVNAYQTFCSPPGPCLAAALIACAYCNEVLFCSEHCRLACQADHNSRCVSLQIPYPSGHFSSRQGAFVAQGNNQLSSFPSAVTLPSNHPPLRQHPYPPYPPLRQNPYPPHLPTPVHLPPFQRGAVQVNTPQQLLNNGPQGRRDSYHFGAPIATSAPWPTWNSLHNPPYAGAASARQQNVPAQSQSLVRQTRELSTPPAPMTVPSPVRAPGQYVPIAPRPERPASALQTSPSSNPENRLQSNYNGSPAQRPQRATPITRDETYVHPGIPASVQPYNFHYYTTPQSYVSRRPGMPQNTAPVQWTYPAEGIHHPSIFTHNGPYPAPTHAPRTQVGGGTGYFPKTLNAEVQPEDEYQPSEDDRPVAPTKRKNPSDTWSGGDESGSAKRRRGGAGGRKIPGRKDEK